MGTLYDDNYIFCIDKKYVYSMSMIFCFQIIYSDFL